MADAQIRDTQVQQGAYDPATIEAKWQRFWEERQTFRAPNPGDPGADPSRPKFYILDMFPYPSGAGLHVGHPVGYCGTDIIARYKRMCGFNVLHPMGFDSFGLPAEQYAIETNVHPAETTRRNIEMYRRQLKMFGFSYDWSRELATSDPAYYRHTQWMFARMFESWYDGEQQRARPISGLVALLESGRIAPRVNPHAAEYAAAANDPRAKLPEPPSWTEASEETKCAIINSYRLAYLADVQVNWCPALGTVLANEEVDNEGRSERGGHPVYRRPLRQWMLRITDYAERLLDDLEGLDWPEPIKLMQRNWIGKSTGAEVAFPLAECWRIEGDRWVHRSESGNGSRSLCHERMADVVRIYTTRPDTLFGATYMVLAPEHPLVARITAAEHRVAVDRYVEQARRRSDLERTAESKEKTGVFTGAYAINPVNGRRIPIWIADYVLMGYGTGAIMAVPGSDIRDFDFARAFGLEVVAVVKPTGEWIDARIEALASEVEPVAKDGLLRLAERFPELAGAAESCRQRSEGLTERTIRTLRESVGLDRLIEHYVRHPASWGAAYTEPGEAVNSPGAQSEWRVPGGVCRLDGLSTEEAKRTITAWLEATGLGRGAVAYKLRDWLFSRQRYWGEPFPVLHGEEGEIVLVPDEELPVELPPMEDFRPTPATSNDTSVPEPPLGRAREWIVVTHDGKRHRRDLNTMPQWAGSCWYYLRFIDPRNPDLFCAAEAQRYWMPVDLYVGGAEHAVLHLLYARFWHKVLYDLGYVSTREPFQRLFNQGMIQGFAYKDRRGVIVSADEVDEPEPERLVRRSTGEPVTRVIAKMSKSLKNVVNPDDVIAQYGADTFRLYEMYMGPLDSSKPWNTRDVPGLYKLCRRIWRLVVDERTGALSPSLCDKAPDEDSLRMLHKTIQRVTRELESLKFNTAIAALFDFVNAMTPRDRRPRAVIEPFVLIFSPFAPHLAEELWERLGHGQTLAYEPWPRFEPEWAKDEQVEIGVQVNGKLRAKIMVDADADEKTIECRARAHEAIEASLSGKTVRKVIVVKGRLVNIVAG